MDGDMVKQQTEGAAAVEKPAQTVQPQPAQNVTADDRAAARAARRAQIDALLAPAYAKASKLKLSKEKQDALGAPFPDDDVEIRPDGQLYIPHILISDRLNHVIGRGQWTLIRRSEKYDPNTNLLYADCVLLVRGCYVGEAIGAMAYIPNNPRMNYSDCVEGAQAEALRRIAAKRLGIGDQVWRPAYCREWIARYAERMPDGTWRKKIVVNAQQTRVYKPQPSTQQPQTEQAEQKEQTEKTENDPTERVFLPLENGVREVWPEHTEDMQVKQVTIEDVLDPVVSKTTGRPGPWRVMATIDGLMVELSTFNKTIAALAQRAAVDGQFRTVAYTVQQKGKYTNRTLEGIR